MSAASVLERLVDSCPPLVFGILGGGRIANDFVQTLKLVPSLAVAAVATRSLDTANSFATKHHIPTHYGSYDELLADPSVQIIYVANVHVFRLEIAKKCLNANKHILLEKPFACSHAEAQEIVDLARAKQLFCAEGMWTRYFPAVVKVREIINSKLLGSVVSVDSDFHFNSADSEIYPTSPLYSKKLAGGACMYVAPYPVAAALMCFPNRPVKKIAATGLVDEQTGVDMQGSVSLKFQGTGFADEGKLDVAAMGGTATCSFGMLGESVEETRITLTGGRMVIHSPAHCPTRVTVREKNPGRGEKGSEETFEFELPPQSDEIYQAGGYYYPNSTGLLYEAIAISKYISEGKLESDDYTLNETLTCMRILDEARKQFDE